MIGIGKGSAHDETTAPGLLRGCHRRIRHFAALADKLAQRGASAQAEGRAASGKLAQQGASAQAEGRAAPAAELADAAAAVHRYFTVALPLHHEDEERTILPRLRGDASLTEPFARMREQHVELDARLTKLVPLWARLAREPHGAPAMKDELAHATEGFAAFLEAHLLLEEETILPALDALAPSTQDEILREMRGRRTT